MSQSYLADVKSTIDNDKELTIYEVLADGEIDIVLRMVAKEPMATFVVTTLADLLNVNHYTVDDKKIADKLKRFGYSVKETECQNM